MSRTIDERIVEMRFDNRQFEQNVQTSLSTLDKLKRGLDLDNAAKSLDGLGDAAKRMRHVRPRQVCGDGPGQIFGVPGRRHDDSFQHHQFGGEHGKAARVRP